MLLCDTDTTFFGFRMREVVRCFGSWMPCVLQFSIFFRFNFSVKYAGLNFLGARGEPRMKNNRSHNATIQWFNFLHSGDRVFHYTPMIWQKLRARIIKNHLVYNNFLWFCKEKMFCFLSEIYQNYFENRHFLCNPAGISYFKVLLWLKCFKWSSYVF